MKVIDRKIIVCLRNKCRRCTADIKEVPKHCMYDVFHVLETTDGDVVEKPRQSGKTTELIGLANELAAAGYPVYFMTRTLDMGNHIKRQYIANKKFDFKIISLGQVQHGGLRGYPDGYIVADEIHPHELEEVMAYMPKSQLVVGYYTSF